MKKVALIIAHEGFQPVEYNTTKDTLTKFDIEVITVSDTPGYAKSTDATLAQVDFTIDQVVPENYDGIFLIGGPGALECLDNEIVHNLLRHVAKLNMPFGAICISPRILAKAGVLDGKNATGWDKDNKLSEIYENHHVNYLPKPVVVDGNIITATGPQATEEFAKEIIKLVNKS